MTLWLVEGQATGLASWQARNEVFSPFGQRGLTFHTFYSDTGNPQPHPKLLATPVYNFASSSRDRLPLKATRGLDRALLFRWVRVKETDRLWQAEINGERALNGLATLVHDNSCRQGGFSLQARQASKACHSVCSSRHQWQPLLQVQAMSSSSQNLARSRADSSAEDGKTARSNIADATTSKQRKPSYSSVAEVQRARAEQK
jgi:hypothetical protein